MVARSGLASLLAAAAGAFKMDVWRGDYGTVCHLLHAAVAGGGSGRGRHTVMMTF